MNRRLKIFLHQILLVSKCQRHEISVAKRKLLIRLSTRGATYNNKICRASGTLKIQFDFFSTNISSLWDFPKLFTVGRKLLVFIFFASCFIPNANADLYLITYATYQGETGHSAIAIENYDILVRDTVIENKSTIFYDTLKNGTLTYYDFWPTVEEEFNLWTADKNGASKFNRLPESFASNQITEWSLMKLGIEKVNDEPCDGLIKIQLNTNQNFQLKEKLDEVIQNPKAFNPTKNNCSDFAKYAIEYITKSTINANENILIKYHFTTPNKLFTEVAKMENTIVLKSPKSKIEGTFLKHKIIPILKTKILNYYKNQNHDTI